MHEVIRHLKRMPKSLCKKKTVWCEIHDQSGEFILRCCNSPILNDAKYCSGEAECGCMHAEVKAILNLIELDTVYRNCYMFCLFSPCTKCAQVIIRSRRIREVYYETLSSDVRGRDFLIIAGIVCAQTN